jgi:GT2 family glycosyltransferase
MDRPFSAIINSFNRVDLLKEALPSLLEGVRKVSVGTSVVVFDAGSTDGSIEYIQNMQEETETPIHLIEPSEGEDTSFSAGVNAGVAYAADRYPELKWCFLYETDNYLAHPEALEEGLRLLRRREELGAVGFTVEKRSGEKTEFGKPFPTVSSFVLGQRPKSWLGLGEPDVEWRTDQGQRFSYCDVVHTSPLLVEQELWKEIGGMDSDTFPFSDSDVDLCWRIAKQGRKCGVLDVRGVMHDNLQQESEWSKSRVLRFHQGRFRVLRKHRGRIVDTIRPLLLVRHFIEWIGLFLMWTVGKRPASVLESRFHLMKLALFEYR